MAVPVIQTRTEAKVSPNSTTITLTAPAGITDGDVLVICIASDGNPIFTFPTGFIEIGQVIGPSNRCTIGVTYKIASGEAGDYTITWSGPEQAVGEMYRIDGAVSGNEIQDPNESNTGTSGIPTITPATATDTDDSLVIVAMAMDDDDITEDGGGDADYVTEDVDRSDTGANTCSIGVQSRGEATVATPPQCDLTLTATEEFAALWFAIRSIAPPSVEVDNLFVLGFI